MDQPIDVAARIRRFEDSIFTLPALTFSETNRINLELRVQRFQGTTATAVALPVNVVPAVTGAPQNIEQNRMNDDDEDEGQITLQTSLETRLKAAFITIKELEIKLVQSTEETSAATSVVRTITDRNLALMQENSTLLNEKNTATLKHNDDLKAEQEAAVKDKEVIVLNNPVLYIFFVVYISFINFFLLLFFCLLLQRRH